MNSLEKADVSGKRVIIWADLDVAVKNGVVVETTRLEHATQTIQYLLEREANLLLIGHTGRPEGRDPSLSLSPIARKLSELINHEIELLFDLSPAQKQVSMLENIRFWRQEEEKDKAFAESVSKLGQIYVNDCFSTSHHAGATMLFLPSFLPFYVGLSLEREVTELSKIMENPKRPLVALIGGAKLDTKLPAITNLASIADTVLVGGKIMFEAVKKTDLPSNVVVGVDDRSQKDVGPKTIELFKKHLEKAATVVWNGPLGLFEEPEFAHGTKEIAGAIAASGAYSVIGGGETIASVDQAGLLDKMNFVSMGGGAMLDFLSGKKLPGLEAIGYYS